MDFEDYPDATSGCFCLWAVSQLSASNAEQFLIVGQDSWLNCIATLAERRLLEAALVPVSVSLLVVRVHLDGLADA